jgi:outer membrane protein assembly factor BamB
MPVRFPRGRLAAFAAAFALLGAALPLAGCDTFFGAPEAPPLPGERISVLKLNSALLVDPEAAQQEVALPQPYRNADWSQAGGNSSHAMHHLALGDPLAVAWTAHIGEAASGSRFLLAEPIAIGGRVYTMDAGMTVSAFDLASGGLAWRVDLTPEDENDDLFGGGLASDGQRVYVSTAFQQIAALDAATGERIWTATLHAPIRAAPALSDGRIFVVTVDNQVFALAADDGRLLWNYQGLPELAGLLGGAAPAVLGPDMVAPFSSGEVIAYRADTGRVLWTDSLAVGARSEALSQLADIRGRPVIDRDLVIAVSNSGITSAIDLASGGRVWTEDFGGSQSPWVAGDYVYMLTRDGDVVCVTRKEGRIRWVQSLPEFENEAEKTDPIQWSGPTLAGDRLLVTGSNGDAYSISPYTGAIIGHLALPGRTHIPAIVVDGTVLIVTDAAELVALR